MAIPIDRDALERSFARIVETYVDDNDITLDLSKAKKRLVPKLIDAVPSAAFDPLQPFDNGLMFFHANVDEGEVVDLQHDLERVHLNLDSKLPITLFLSSTGGSVYAGLALISTIHDIQRKGRKVNVHVQGVAMSMGSVIVQAADHRSIEPTAFFMLHEVSYGMQGTTADHEEERLFTTSLQDALFYHYSARTGKPIKYYRDKTHKKTWYLTAQEALAEGLVDEIVTAPRFTLPFMGSEKTEKPKRRSRSSTSQSNGVTVPNAK